MKQILLIVLLLFAAGSATEANAQLLKKAKEAAKKATERQVEKRTEKAVDKAFDKTEEVVIGTGNSDNSGNNQQAGETNQEAGTDQAGNSSATAPPKGQSLEMAYSKSDFVAGDEIIFEDLLVGEKLGEFPSMWDLVNGNAEVALIGGEKAIFFVERSTIVPLMENPKSYLPDEFTIEMDVYQIITDDKHQCSRYLFTFYDKDRNESQWDLYDWGKSADYSFARPGGGDKISGSYKSEPLIKLNDWNHIAFSFNKRAFKVYINGIRVTNIPNTVHNTWFTISRYSYEHHTGCYIKNIRIAKGAVPLYDRMMSDGKFITYGITFDVGKSTIKPESMGEINRIVTLMTENTDLKFSVEGHTDNTGNAAANQTLSEARSKAIVDKLVENGVAADRLTSAGKGQNTPIADNSTDEGRAKNRRVEFVKQ